MFQNAKGCATGIPQGSGGNGSGYVQGEASLASGIQGDARATFTNHLIDDYDMKLQRLMAVADRQEGALSRLMGHAGLEPGETSKEAPEIPGALGQFLKKAQLFDQVLRVLESHTRRLEEFI